MATSVIPVSRTSIIVPIDFCGMHFEQVLPIAGQYKHTVLHDAYGCEWYSINTSNGTYNWTKLDAFVATVGANPWTYVVWGTPLWASARPSELSPYYATASTAEPTSMANLATFITALCNRYTGLVRIEVWNEPDLIEWYTGTVSTFVTLSQTVYNAAKAVRGGIDIVGPSHVSYITSWFNNFLIAGGGAYVDAWSLHGYLVQWRSPNASVVGLLLSMGVLYNTASQNGVTKSRIYMTEFGHFDARTELTDAAYILSFQRGMLVAAAMGIKQAAWYAYDDTPMGYSGRTAILNGIAAFITLISGATLTNVSINMPECSINATINGTTYLY